MNLGVLGEERFGDCQSDSAAGGCDGDALSHHEGGSQAQPLADDGRPGDRAAEPLDDLDGRSTSCAFEANTPRER